MKTILHLSLLILPILAFSQEALILSQSNWKFKKVYASTDLEPGKRASYDLTKIKGLPYRFLKIKKSREQGFLAMEVYLNFEGESDPSVALEVDSRFEEWVVKIGNDRFARGEQTWTYGKRKGFVAYEFYFPVHLLDSLIRHRILRQKLKKEEDSWGFYTKVWSGTNIFEFAGTSEVQIKKEGGALNIPVFVLKQTLKAQGHGKDDICPRILNVERTYWVSKNINDPLILKFEEYHEDYCNNENPPHSICPCPRGPVRYRQGLVTEAFPRQ